MMRSPHSFVVVCRRPDKSIALKEAPWRSVHERLGFLRWPFLRGTVVFWEALSNGLQALSFSAEQQQIEGEQQQADAGSKAAIGGTLVFSLLLAFLLFGALPHALAWLFGWATGLPMDEGKSIWFHATDGVIKLAIFLGYLWGISRIPEIRRVFGYHGAEHKAIFTYEAGQALTLENARQHSTFHPRCGTSFLILVLMVSILVFTGVFSGPWMPVFFAHRVLNQAAYIVIKLPLMFPIAGLSYEVLRLSGKWPKHPLLRPIIVPGLLLQRITTKPPSDEMLEVALLSLRKVLWRESQHVEGAGSVPAFGDSPVEVYAGAADVDLPLTFAAAQPKN